MTAAKMSTTRLNSFRFFDAANRLYHFLVWSEYCDWFIEFIKAPEELEARKKAKDSTAVEILEESLRMLHPFMPFVTEEIWQGLSVKENVKSIALASSSQVRSQTKNENADRRVGRVIKVVDSVCALSAARTISPRPRRSAVNIVGSNAVLSELKPLLGSHSEACTRKDTLIDHFRDAGLTGQVMIPLDDVKVLWPSRGSDRRSPGARASEKRARRGSGRAGASGRKARKPHLRG